MGIRFKVWVRGSCPRSHLPQSSWSPQGAETPPDLAEGSSARRWAGCWVCCASLCLETVSSFLLRGEDTRKLFL